MARDGAPCFDERGASCSSARFFVLYQRPWVNQAIAPGTTTVLSQ